MLKEELIKLVDNIIIEKCEGQTLEIKSANKGFPKIYDTLSSFSNQTQGGIIIFGIEESKTLKLLVFTMFKIYYTKFQNNVSKWNQRLEE